MSYLSSIRIAGSAVLAAFLIALMSGPGIAQESGLLTANAALDEAFRNGNTEAIDGFLDPEFTWVFKDGSQAFRSDVVRLLPVPGTSNGEEQEIMERTYGK